MDKSDFVIIGGVAAGPKTAVVLARRLPKASIRVFQMEKHLSYGTCGMPYFASGDINSFEELTQTSYGVPRDPKFFRNVKGVEVTVGAEVTAINRTERTVTVRLLESGETFEYGYGKLVLATGATPKRPPFPVADSPKIRPFTKPEDAMAFRKLAQTGQIGKAVVVGAGFIGCEVAEAAGGLWGIEVELVEKEPQLLPYVLDPEMAQLVERELGKQGVTVRTGRSITTIKADEDGTPVVCIDGGKEIAADYVFLALGVTPNVALARAAGLEIGVTGAVKVDRHLRTSDEHIYAGGDCIETMNMVSGQPMYIPMGSLANRHGRVIAENLAGHATEFAGAVGAFLVKVFDVNVGAAGLSEMAAKRAGINAKSLIGTFPDKPDYYPEFKTFTLKLVYNPADGRLLGLQAVGAGDICRRIDVFSAFLQRGGRLDDLLDHEQGYAPPYAEALDPLYHLACMAEAAGRGVSFIDLSLTTAADIGEVQLVDVRRPDECESEPFTVAGWAENEQPQALNIPLEEIRARASELDAGKRIILICKRGPRSYQAALILRAAGFGRVDIHAGGLRS